MTTLQTMIDEDELQAMKAYEEFLKRQAESEPPKCHFRRMTYMAADYETWWACLHCGHTKLISGNEGER